MYAVDSRTIVVGYSAEVTPLTLTLNLIQTRPLTLAWSAVYVIECGWPWSSVLWLAVIEYSRLWLTMIDYGRSIDRCTQLLELSSTCQKLTIKYFLCIFYAHANFLLPGECKRNLSCCRHFYLDGSEITCFCRLKRWRHLIENCSCSIIKALVL